ncbi:MAG: bifunctional proline dehydrogenase/L-glutamate gamma-semialdehyde dehydrogenase PutA [Sphingopyxis sp.]|uniref:bifunctional proline dehydrogenase/L-glutamate gamma-semialdehyde dehydrogenase PutA n=1 Tax=Sphingopyxis sp. TaxID=1908224 RepID=UPI002ABB40C6|nr:bifunctional proline dehydrogenase/L-glutamate gamma-semialdehyde dehydrogenase PutA [Sphingopyxis sp.]MDZ3831479.1 bifunctional proline dehydrogenase/L-glutamate gamma-semialdehyde dehydrogenase PutA [Sphingopyxis sp.]
MDPKVHRGEGAGQAGPDHAARAALHYGDERAVIAALLPMARRTPAEHAAIDARLRDLLPRLRQDRGGLVERFMQEYPLGSAEGVALLSLAEAYLRVPDRATASRLIADKFAAGDWAIHRGRSNAALVNGATRGLMLARALQAPGAGAMRTFAARLGDPVIRRAVATGMQVMGGQFVLGRTAQEALKRAARHHYVCSFDMLGEAARTAADAARYFRAYQGAIAAASVVGVGKDHLNRHSVSIKLSALHPRYEEAQRGRVMAELVPAVVALAEQARAGGIGITIDAEEADRLELSLDLIAGIAAAPSLAGWDGLGMAVQAYQKRAPAVIEWVDALGARTARKIAVRLVKGAYWDSEIKHAQEQGVPGYPVFTRKDATDVCYLACARLMLAARHIAPAFATHNAVTVATLLEWIGDRRDVEFQRLHGMGEPLYRAALANSGLRVRVYAPVGGYRDLLPYLVRRLLENGANTSFVHQFGDADCDVEALIVDPVDLISRTGGAPHPAIPLPQHLYGAERRNSEGYDLNDRLSIDAAEAAVRAVPADMSRAAPIVGGRAATGQAIPVHDPATGAAIGQVVEAAASDIERALAGAAAAAPGWAARAVAERGACLDRMADLLEDQREQYYALVVREAGKSIADAVGEVREAVDFCRYYADQARRRFVVDSLPGPTGERNELTLAARGVFACISPWNFPLAIFLGQVSAALVAGNAVVAKPAPQTPLIAAAAVRLFHAAGVPVDVLHLLPGGPDVGRALVADRRVAGVAFTGSTAAARQIARSLLDDEGRPLVPLIAETGGLNAMIVDSTALPEQVVADVITSAFQSAGQRCSALRLLCLQDDIADQVLELLTGAMQELTLGDPGRATSDVGPVIDAEAQRRIEAHIAAHRERLVVQLPVPAGLDGHFVGPAVIALDGPEALRHEIFGPVLHVVRWKAGDLDRLVERIGASGYGLTMGLHSRLDTALETVRARARVGNLYVNRSMIGAVVGSQPFGGEGLSGTGFKAGGPHYLLRFVTERSISIDTTSAGGNASLFALEIDEPVG